MKQSVYIETSIPSFYFEIRKEPDMIARRNWTRQWWEHYSHLYDLYTSDAVVDELSNGDYPTKNETIPFLLKIYQLPILEDISEIVEVYIKNKLMPIDPLGDALHLALASYYKCDFLLTWNCKHLANANKFAQIKRLNTILGLFVPTLITPLQLLGG
jgi:predicted nucleic acid-binding protein